MSDAVPELSAVCARSDHDRCPHRAAMRSRLWRRPRVVEVQLCRCPCHADCPLAVQPTVTQDVWAATCACPGAARSRASFEQRRQRSRIVADVDFSDHPDAEEIESRLRAVFEEHGQRLPRGLTRRSRLIAGATAQRGTGYQVAVGAATAATVLTGAAIASSGRRRLVLGAGAVGAWLASGYAVSAVAAIGQLTRSVEDHPRAQDLPSR